MIELLILILISLLISNSFLFFALGKINNFSSLKSLLMVIIKPIKKLSNNKFFFNKLLKENHKNEIFLSNNQIKLSLVIPFKNEKENLPDLVESLINLNYNKDLFEIIFVNDNSNDNSESILIKSNLTNYKIISAHNKRLPGKKGALDLGIKNANHDFIVITDADCKPLPDWLKSISSKFNEGYDLTFGYSPLVKENTLISRISSYENLRNFLLYFASVELGLPFGATARSLAFKKKVYDNVKGYNNTIETLSGDDDLFIRECVKNNFRIGYFLDSSSFVFSKSSKTFSDYIKRKRRHLKTSHHYLFKHKVILGIWYLSNQFSTFSVLLLPFSILFIIPFFTKLLFDVLIVLYTKNTLRHNFHPFEIISLEIFYQFLIPLNFVNSIFSKDKWN